MTTQPRSEEAIELAWMANAYVGSASQLCKWMLEDELERSVHHYKVPLHLAYLTIELAYKAGLVGYASGYPPHHDLVQLKRLYEQCVPHVPIPIPRYIDALLPGVTNDLFPSDPAPTASWHFTRFRYYADRTGRPFPLLEPADIEELKQELDDLSVAVTGLLLELRGVRVRSPKT